MIVLPSPKILVCLVILFDEKQYLPKNTGTWCLKKSIGIFMSLNHYRMFYIEALMINMKWKAFFFFLSFWRPHPQYMEFPRLAV